MGDLHRFARVASVTYKRAWRWGAGHPAVPRITEILKRTADEIERERGAVSQDPGRYGDADGRAVPELDDVRAVRHVHGTDDAHDALGPSGGAGAGSRVSEHGSREEIRRLKGELAIVMRSSRTCNSECPSWSHGWTFRRGSSRNDEHRWSCLWIE